MTSEVNVRAVAEPLEKLGDYARIPIAFEVRRVVVIPYEPCDDGSPDADPFLTRAVPEPYVKDYDAIPGNHPTAWKRIFTGARLAMLVASVGGERAGGAIVLCDAPRLSLLGGRRDLALLWDLRVAPARRGHGVGRALFAAAESWAGAASCTGLLIETQDVNVPASRFYARQGCRLGAAHPQAYADCPEEVQLLWYKPLGGTG